jgi:Cu/Ag efflux pump CusA
MALAGGAIGAWLGGGALSLGSLAGFLTVLGLAVRHGFLLISRYRDLRHRDGMAFGPELVLQGTGDRAAAIVTAVIVTAVAVLPFAVFGGRAGHEILGPMALVILGGLVTTTLYALYVVPALYSRFGADAIPEAVDSEDLDVAV